MIVKKKHIAANQSLTKYIFQNKKLANDCLKMFKLIYFMYSYAV